ncbi:MAG: iron ABC transporter permease [Burkholderiales bacterium]|jgi:iron complex transport system permease protein|nr:iron ABC transporter permease [Burkholderiales bacterium]
MTHEKRVRLKLLATPAVLIVVVASALCFGHYPIKLPVLMEAFFSSASVSNEVKVVLWDIRFPRIMAAILCGAALSVAGAAYQGMFKNPLVSPDILGVSSGAGLGASLAIFLNSSMLVVQLYAFAGGLATVGIVCFVSRFARYHSPVLSMVLSGIAVGALVSAGVSLFKILSDPYTQLMSITFWLMGGLNSIVAQDLYSVAPVVVLGLLPLFLLRWRMNLLSLDDEEAQALGVNVRWTRLIFIVCATLITASVVSISGIIGWVGLVVPHIARLWIGPDFSKLLPAALFIGAAFLVLTDLVARTIAPIEIPLGIITAFVGAPFFIALLIQGGERK